jgi:hypothetical protein
MPPRAGLPAADAVDGLLFLAVGTAKLPMTGGR